MQILFVHQDFPAQFGHIARHLAKTPGWRCDFVTEAASASLDGVRTIPYRISGGARETTHYFSRTFENAVWHAHAVHQACESAHDLRPDLVVGHSGFGSTLYLPERFPGVPVVNYFEHFYHPHGSDLDFRPDFPPEPRDFLRARTRNAMILLDLDNCRLGYSPTRYQKSLFPDEYQHKIDVILDGPARSSGRGRGSAPGGAQPVGGGQEVGDAAIGLLEVVLQDQARQQLRRNEYLGASKAAARRPRRSGVCMSSSP